MGYDRIMGLIWFIIGSGMAIQSGNLGLGTLQAPGIGFVSFLVGISLGLSGIALVIYVTLKGKAKQGLLWEKQHFKNLGLPILALFIYCIIT